MVWREAADESMCWEKQVGGDTAGSDGVQRPFGVFEV